LLLAQQLDCWIYRHTPYLPKVETDVTWYPEVVESRHICHSVLLYSNQIPYLSNLKHW